MIKILIVEDDFYKLNDIKKILESNGIYSPAYDFANNVTDALVFLKKTSYDILILDLSLPLRANENPIENGGVRILKKLSSKSYCSPMYLLGLTQYSDLSDKYQSLFKEIDFNVYSYNNDEWHTVLSNKVSWVKKNKKTNLKRENNKDVFILTHGVMTSADWQNTFISTIKKDNSVYLPYKYNYFSALKILFPFTRRSVENSYQNFLQDVIIKYPDAKIHFISHSFGTYLTMESLKNSKYDFDPNIGYIILSGSVLKTNYPITDVIEKYQPIYIINECGFNDIPLILCNLFSIGLGNGGKNGFHGCNDRLINRYYDGGHSYFFENTEFIKNNWLPIFESNIITHYDERDRSGKRDLFESILNVISPFTRFFAILLILFYFILFYFILFYFLK
ncbi:TPA: hypothetical protein ACPZQB_000701 [Yersinia enterocolitica]